MSTAKDFSEVFELSPPERAEYTCIRRGEYQAMKAVVDAAKRLDPGSWAKGHPGAVAYRSRWMSEASYKEFVDALAKFEEVCGETE
jgi:hypothetical protein